MFNIGDHVRLANGWTIMVVLYVNHRTSEVVAKYVNHRPATSEDFRNPYSAQNTYIRHFSKFVFWDGEPKKGMPSMAQYRPLRYRTKDGRTGTFMSQVSSKTICLNMSSDPVEEMPELFKAKHLTEIIPLTFAVKSAYSSYRCSYEVPPGAVIELNDMLLSDSGNVYVVTAVDTRDRNPKRVFKGRRVKLQEL